MDANSLHVKSATVKLLGSDLFYETYQTPEPRDALIFFHNFGEHHRMHTDFLRELAFKLNTKVYAFDLPGHGLSGGERVYIDNFKIYVDLFSEILSFLDEKKISIVGDGLGSLIALSGLEKLKLQAAQKIKALVLLSPMIKMQLAALNALQKYFKFKLSYDQMPFWMRHLKIPFPAESEKNSTDLLSTKKIAVGLILAMYEMSHRLVLSPYVLKSPCLLLHGDKDTLTSHELVEIFAKTMDKNLTRRINYEEASSNLLESEIAPKVKSDIIQWLEKF